MNLNKCEHETSIDVVQKCRLVHKRCAWSWTNHRDTCLQDCYWKNVNCI